MGVTGRVRGQARSQRISRGFAVADFLDMNIIQTENQFAAIVMGGTGSVGAHLVNKLIKSPLYSRVTVISRRELPRAPNLNLVVWDDFADALFVHPEKAVAIFEGHDVGFCCLGASRQHAIGLLYNPKKFGKSFRTVDYEYVVGAASAAHRAGVPYFSVISTLGADPAARFLYNRIKGEVERALQDIDFAGLSIFQPSQLMRDAAQRGPFLERVGLPVYAFLNRFLPAKYRGIQVEDVAEAMKVEFERRMAKQGENVAFYQSDIIQELAGRRS